MYSATPSSCLPPPRTWPQPGRRRTGLRIRRSPRYPFRHTPGLPEQAGTRAGRLLEHDATRCVRRAHLALPSGDAQVTCVTAGGAVVVWPATGTANPATSVAPSSARRRHDSAAQRVFPSVVRHESRTRIPDFRSLSLAPCPLPLLQVRLLHARTLRRASSKSRS